jgi:DNA-binding response OmpR family regulator
VSHPSASPRILVVDDDRAICQLYHEVLAGEGYDVITATTRAEALAKLDAVGGVVDALILDISLPDADGNELAADIVAKIGQRPTLYVSGWTEEFWDLSNAPRPWVLLQKPIPIPELLASVERLCAGVSKVER